MPLLTSLHFKGSSLTEIMAHSQAQSSVQAPNVTDESMDEEVDATSLRNLSDLLINEWEKLGDKLGVTPAKVYSIKKDNHGNEDEMKFKMLLTWQQMNGRNATFRILCDKLREVGRGDLGNDTDQWRNNLL